MKEFLSFNKLKILSYYQDAVKLLKGEIIIPRMLSVWLSQVCNLRCEFCLFSDYNREVNKFMDTRKFIEFINEVSSLGIEGVEFCGGGESMMHPDFYQIAEYVKFKGLKVGVLTNGTVMDVERMVKTFSYVRLSLDAVTAELYNQLKHPVVDGMFEKVKENAKKLVEMRGKKDKPHIGLKFLVMKDNLGYISEAVKIAMDLKVDYIQFKRVHSSAFELTKKDEEEAERILALCKESDRIAVVGGVRKIILKSKCFMAPIHVVMDSDGNIYVCCYFEGRDLKIGNVFENRFLDVWGSEKHKRIIGGIDINECNKVDCRWARFNEFMGEVIKDDIMDISFI